MISVGAFASGSLLNAVVFAIIGNDWKIEYLQYNMYVGLLLAIPAVLSLPLMSEKYALDNIEEQEA